MTGSPWLDEVSFWCAMIAWAGWLLLATGRTRLGPGDRRRDGGTLAIAWATLLVSLAAAILLAFARPDLDLPGPQWAARLAGAVLAGLGTGLRLWAIRALGASFTQVVVIRDDQHLVAAGPYRFVRHPGYAGTLLTLAGLAMTLDNWASLAILSIGTFIGHLPRIRVEERALEEQFGDDYRQFARARKRLIPGVW